MRKRYSASSFICIYCSVFTALYSIVISLPREVLEYLDIREGAEIEVNLDRDNRQVIIKPVRDTR